MSPTEKELLDIIRRVRELLDIIRRVRDELFTPMDLFKRQRWIAETVNWLTGVLVKYEERQACPKCGSDAVEAHIQSVIGAPGRFARIAVHSVGWRCMKCQHIWGHEGFATGKGSPCR